MCWYSATTAVGWQVPLSFLKLLTMWYVRTGVVSFTALNMGAGASTAGTGKKGSKAAPAAASSALTEAADAASAGKLEKAKKIFKASACRSTLA